MLLDGTLDSLMQGGIEVLCLFQFVRIAFQGLCHRSIEHDIGAGNGIGGAHHAELKLVAGEGRGTIAVRGVPDKTGQHIDPQLHLLSFYIDVGGIGLNGIQHSGQLIAQKDRDHGGRRFIGSQSVVVSGRCDRSSQQSLIVVHRLNDSRQKQQELGIFVGGLAGREQVDAGIGGKGPVVMFAAAVDPGKGLFMQQAHQIVAVGHLLHDLHRNVPLHGDDGHRLFLRKPVHP